MSADEDQGGAAVELTEVLWDRLGPQEEATTGPQRRLEALRVLRARRARRRRASQQVDPDVAALFGMLDVAPADLGRLNPEIAAYVQQGLQQGLSRDALPAVFQAYVRAVGRIVAAETAIARELLAATPQEDQARVLSETLDTLLPAAPGAFDLLHRMLLLDALVDAVSDIDESDGDGDVLAVAMVDLVGSTRYLSTVRPTELERLVDALFTAGQSATARRSAYVVKYVGDGLFVAGRDVTEVADVALDVIARLEGTLPLRARGGLAWGTVVQRAGDLFGLPINVAHIATKAARPGMLIATAPAAAQLPAARRGRYRTVHTAHPALGDTLVATVRPAAIQPTA